MSKKLKLTGEKFGLLTVIKKSEKRGKYHKTYWNCSCSCGTKNHVASTSNLNAGLVKSCGCLKLKNILGEEFGFLTVIKKLKTPPGNGQLWKCRCICGKFKNFFTKELRLGRAGVRSCGCKQYTHGNKNPGWTGFGEISGSRWNRLLDSARERNYKVDFDKEYIWNLFLIQDRLCALSGLKLELPQTYRTTGTASLDRIDSSKGYIKGNVQWVHKDINFMKQRFGQEYFIDICRKITDAQNLKTWCVTKRNGN